VERDAEALLRSAGDRCDDPDDDPGEDCARGEGVTARPKNVPGAEALSARAGAAAGMASPADCDASAGIADSTSAVRISTAGGYDASGPAAAIGALCGIAGGTALAPPCLSDGTAFGPLCGIAGGTAIGPLCGIAGGTPIAPPCLTDGTAFGPLCGIAGGTGIGPLCGIGVSGPVARRGAATSSAAAKSCAEA
jgi:hypothetical protein